MRLVRRILVCAATAALTTAGVIAAAPAATAAPASPAAASGLAGSLGADRTAGVYRDATGRMIVNVTDAAAAATVRAAGAHARVVRFSDQALDRLMNRLDTGVAGTAWAMDPAADQLVISVDPSVRAADAAKLRAAAARSGGAARVETLRGAITPLISGGDAIYGGQFRCSLGFNVRSGSTYSFLTAGHCTNSATEWFSNANHTTKLGDRTGSSFPGNDYGIVRYINTSISIDGTVGGQDITSAGNAFVGESVTRRGSTTGVHSGTVTALNVTVHYTGGGTVRGMIQTNVCARARRQRRSAVRPDDRAGPDLRRQR